MVIRRCPPAGSCVRTDQRCKLYRGCQALPHHRLLGPDPQPRRGLLCQAGREDVYKRQGRDAAAVVGRSVRQHDEQMPRRRTGRKPQKIACCPQEMCIRDRQWTGMRSSNICRSTRRPLYLPCGWALQASFLPSSLALPAQ